MDKQKIIYICGLGHSGSTILDMSLAVLPKVVGLGELYTLFNEQKRKRHFKSLCSCGKAASECDFWSEFSENVNHTKATEEQYQDTLKLFADKFGSDAILIDSSKNSYPYLEFLNKEYDLKVIYLTRDYRSWSYSRHLSTRKPYLYFLLRWQLENIKLLSQLKQMKIDSLKVGYEELALFPEQIFKVICEYTGLEYSEHMLVPEHTNSHIISGNIARVDKQKRSRWMYDARWFLSRRITFWGILSLCLSRKNKKLVYSNIWTGDIRNFHMFGNNQREKMSQKYN